jgi:membrane protein implicated in regulation of membrane protease activity
MSFEPTYWHWLMLACVFLVVEIAAPSAFFLWLCIAAVASAAVGFMAPDISWQAQYIIFAVFCVLSLVAWKKFTKEGSVSETDQPTLNQANRRYIGRTLVLSQAIVNGLGKVTVDDSQWQVRGVDADVGSRVKVLDVIGSVLQVELVEATESA